MKGVEDAHGGAAKADLIRMDPVAGCQLLNRSLSFDGLQSNLGLERAREPPPLSSHALVET